MEPINDISKLISGNSDSGKKELTSEIRTQPENKDLYKKLKLAWALISSSKEMPEDDIEKSYQELQKRLKVHDSKKLIFTLSRYAAVLIIVLGITALTFYMGRIYDSNSEKRNLYTKVVADYGQISKVILPDNSIVWLNSGSTLTYNNNFSVDNRNLILSGQAFFEIQKNRKLPLLLNAKNIQVRVLGTKFCVNAYPEEDNVKVILETGKVELSVSKIGSERYIMFPGQIAMYSSNGDSIKIEETDANDFISWKDGELVFKEMPLEEVLRILERRFNIEFIKNSPKIKKSVFTATFKNETLTEILDFISFSTQIDYKLDNTLTNSKQKITLN